VRWGAVSRTAGVSAGPFRSECWQRSQSRTECRTTSLVHVHLSDPPMSVALGGVCGRKSRRGRQRYETRYEPVVAGPVNFHKNAG
jgi:hypothetical protein